MDAVITALGQRWHVRPDPGPAQLGLLVRPFAAVALILQAP